MDPAKPTTIMVNGAIEAHVRMGHLDEKRARALMLALRSPWVAAQPHLRYGLAVAACDLLAAQGAPIPEQTPPPDPAKVTMMVALLPDFRDAITARAEEWTTVYQERRWAAQG